MKRKHLAKQFSRNRLDERSNILRAAVLGANDGIISIAALVIGVATATESSEAVLAAGIAGILAGAVSIGAGEYVSVSTQRDVESSELKKEKEDLKKHPKEELELLTEEIEAEGVGPIKAKRIATELTEANAYLVHAATDFHIDPKHLSSPWSSVIASSFSFVLGALIPLGFILLPIGLYTEVVVFVSVIIALTISGIISSVLSDTPRPIRSTLRVIAGGVIAMVATYALGTLFYAY